MYFKLIETNSVAKANYNKAHSEHAAVRMKAVRKKAAGIRRGKKLLAAA